MSSSATDGAGAAPARFAADRARSWSPPSSWGRIETLETHAAGEPLRIVIGGLPPIPGDTILAKRRWARANVDDLRRALMWEPRGHADMYGALVTEPVTTDGDCGVLFVHNEGFSTMCGHGIVALVTAGLTTGALTPADPDAIRIDTPAGRVTARANLDADGSLRDVSFTNVPSFVVALDVELDIEGHGTVRADVAFGGAFYVYVDARTLGVRLEPDAAHELVTLGRRIKRAAMDQVELRHPDGDADLDFVYGTIFVDLGDDGDVRHSRNVCVFADGEVDRSPTGTGVSGRAAIHVARGEVAIGEALTVESIVGSSFTVTAIEAVRVGGHDGVVPDVRGRAWLTGRTEHWLADDDPFRTGFFVR